MNNSTTAFQKRQAPERVRLYPEISCATFVEGGAYEMRDTNYFDVPDEMFDDGYVTGLRITCEIMSAARKGDFDSFYSVIVAAVKVLEAGHANPAGTLDGQGAASSFLIILSEIMEVAAKKLDLTEFMTNHFRFCEAEKKDALLEMTKTNAEFVKTLQPNVGQEVTEV